MLAANRQLFGTLEVRCLHINSDERIEKIIYPLNCVQVCSSSFDVKLIHAHLGEAIEMTVYSVNCINLYLANYCPVPRMS